MVESEANVRTLNLRPNPAHILCDRNRRWNRNGPGQLVSDADQAVIHVSFVVYRTRFCSVVMVIRELNSLNSRNDSFGGYDDPVSFYRWRSSKSIFLIEKIGLDIAGTDIAALLDNP